MIIIDNQIEMLDIAEIFLHQETELTQLDVFNMTEFDKYYEARELVKEWNTASSDEIKRKQLWLEVMGIEFKTTK